MRREGLLYVALGDSTGVGVGARAGGGYPERLVGRAAARGEALRLENLCVSGARGADVRRAQLPRALALDPDVVTVAIGVNDVTHGTGAASLEDDLGRVGEALAASDARVVIANVLDLARSPLVPGHFTAPLRARIEAVNRVIAGVAARHGFDLVDVHDATRADLAFHPELVSDDGFHPSDAGYEVFTDLLEPAFRVACQRASGG